MSQYMLLASFVAICLQPWTSLATQPKAVGIEFTKDEIVLPNIARRDATVPVALDNGRILYLMDISIGTPPQKLRVQLDTGSADTWVPSNHEDLCLAKKEDCQNTGAYALNRSTTGVQLHQNISFSYGTAADNQGGAQGAFVKDTVRIGGYELKQVQFGVVEKKTTAVGLGANTGLKVDTHGVIGVASEAVEAGFIQGTESQYPTILSVLKEQGKIASRAFSLFLNSLEAPSGTILFGGVDSTKYTGPLVSVPIVPNPSAPTKIQPFSVQLTGLTAQSPAGVVSILPANNTVPLWSILDSGAPQILLPDHYLEPLFQYLGATFAQELGFPVVPCNLSTSDVVFSFYFAGPLGPKINIPIGDIVLPQLPIENGATYSDGSPYCFLGIGPSHQFFALLGDPFLRSAYVVYDLENSQIALAQADLESTAEPNIQEIKPGYWGIPGVSVIKEVFPFNNATIIADSQPDRALVVNASVLPSNWTLPSLPRHGSVTAVAPAGSLYTATGFVMPHVGTVGSAGSTGTAGAGHGGTAGTGRVGPRPTSTHKGSSTSINPPIASASKGAAGKNSAAGLLGISLASLLVIAYC